MTSAFGIAVGLGRYGAAAIGMVLTVIILGVVGALTRRLEIKDEAKLRRPDDAGAPARPVRRE